jgi:anaerobic dimethyl sulfoxide reductase subunit B (iron-sulfur subunit)
MPGGFNFNIDKCVACHACVVGCSLENAFDIPWRRVFNDMVDIYPGLPVHNISMACNHCEEALCMIGCPANAYFRDDSTGAIRIIADRCIGCNYCYWNCPYDAPQFGAEENATMQKCNLCLDRLAENKQPICVDACIMHVLDAGPIEELQAKYGNIRQAEGCAYSDQLIPSIVFKPKKEAAKGLTIEKIAVSPPK